MVNTLQSDMIHIAGGEFVMGSDRHYPEEAPTRTVSVEAFWIDETPVTNAQFAQFVEDTGYITRAEIAPTLEEYPAADPSLLVAGSSVFVAPEQQPATANPMLWWSYCPGADWRHPQGPDSSIEGLADHPVVHVAQEDALAYARWCRKRLPSEAEWEYAARAGHDGRPYAWGDELMPKGRVLANFWHGTFPSRNTSPDGFVRTSPVRAYPANDFALYDMIGNVWEWTSDDYSLPREVTKKCCTPQGNPLPGEENFKLIKGGSHLCAENYCQRYRPAARYPQTPDTCTSHIGFRCARSA